ncbi:MAG: DUF1080 domain-containing protein [Planctomycetota bacterium]
MTTLRPTVTALDGSSRLGARVLCLPIGPEGRKHFAMRLAPRTTRKTHDSNRDPHSKSIVRLLSQPLALLLFAGCLALNGCSASTEPDDSAPVANASNEATESQPVEIDFETASYDATSDELLASRLPSEETREGWVRLFDGHTLFGWESTGKANFRVEEGAIVVDQGKPALLCSSSTWGDFELTLEFKATKTTNSGVFVRTPLEPENPELDCYEINIAPLDNPFPTGSLVGRQKADAVEPVDAWREMRIIADGKDVRVEIDGETVCRYQDPVDLPARRVGLQHRKGRVAFRAIKIRPLGLEPLLDEGLTQWTRYPEMPGKFEMSDDQTLHVTGGSAQLETEQSYGDFTLLAEYKIDQPGMNSGLFFRCIPGDKMMGYECQINNDFKDDSRLMPEDCGTGGIFRRQDARLVAGENGSWATVLLQAHGTKISAWVNGIGVSDWEDTREEHENPRKGRRTEPGTIMIQAHDPKTDLLYRNLKIASP